MFANLFSGKRFIPVAVAAVVSVTALAASTTASQAYYPGWGGYGHGWGHHGYGGWGYGAPVAAGLLAGAFIANAQRPYYGDCYVVRRRVIDYYGRPRLVRRTVCE